MKLILFSGEMCHLCDQAELLIKQVAPQDATAMQKVNVKQDHQLFHLYGARIPVLKRTDTDNELGWPFDASELEEFLR